MLIFKLPPLYTSLDYQLELFLLVRLQPLDERKQQRLIEAVRAEHLLDGQYASRHVVHVVRDLFAHRAQLDVVEVGRIQQVLLELELELVEQQHALLLQREQLPQLIADFASEQLAARAPRRQLHSHIAVAHRSANATARLHLRKLAISSFDNVRMTNLR